ncbi:MAG: hypothetical protein RIR62_285 [Pseudomonadota bacterium]|jgi:4-hydroxy-2-oxoheptanedioate aldolase
MRPPVNRFKRALREGRQQIGLWNQIPNALVAEMLATAAFDWIVIDTEHALTDVPDTLPLMQAMAPHGTHPVVRPASNDPVLVKRLLDLGAQTLLIPYVQDEAEAAKAVAAIRYAPRGMRGVATFTRASVFGQVTDYVGTAEEELCLILQIETAEAVERIAAIAAVDGVDALFIGPADLAASMGHGGDLRHPEVVAMIERAIRAITAAGKPAGILTADPVFARQCIDWGTTFTAVGIDMLLLAQASRALARQFREG